MGDKPPQRAPRPPGDPGGDRPPRPIPWTPFGPGDHAAPDPDLLLKRVAKVRLGLEGVQRELATMRDGRPPDNDHPLAEVTRADGLWPYLLIRWKPGDVGKRPLTIADLTEEAKWTGTNSPDVIVIDAGAIDLPRIVGRAGIQALGTGRPSLIVGSTYDVWAHVWNLGRSHATGVRVRARLGPSPFNWPPGAPIQPERFLGGTTLDLGDRLSDTSHLAVKVATFTTDDLGDDYSSLLTVTAECLSDVANEDKSPNGDRHSGHYVLVVSS